MPRTKDAPPSTLFDSYKRIYAGSRTAESWSHDDSMLVLNDETGVEVVVNRRASR
jgi:hypothetical protein